jgi:hypothetical protein
MESENEEKNRKLSRLTVRAYVKWFKLKLKE